MRAIKLISAVAFAALLLTSCEGSDPVIAKLQPYQMVNKMYDMTQSQVDSIFANINYAKYQMVDEGMTMSCYIEDSTKLALLAECLSGENTSGSDFISLGTVYQYYDWGHDSIVAGYMHFCDTKSLAMADYTVVSNWAKSNLCDGKNWQGVLEDTGNNRYVYYDGTELSDNDKAKGLGTYTDYMSKFSALADSLDNTDETATIDGIDNTYNLGEYAIGDAAYGLSFRMNKNGATAE